MLRNRWFQLGVGIFAMVMIANLQYGWTLFVDPIDKKTGFGRVFIQSLLTTFILFETWLVPFEAYLVDRFGPRVLVGIGGLLVGVSWFTNSVATTQAVFTAAGAAGSSCLLGTTMHSAAAMTSTPWPMPNKAKVA